MATSGREAYTVEAAVCADGTFLPPSVLFKGKNIMSQWGECVFTGRLAVTETGWMNSGAFHNWFKWFATEVTARPLLLIMDGHSSHLSYSTIDLVSCQLASKVSYLSITSYTDIQIFLGS